jgi:hypothetical protein
MAIIYTQTQRMDGSINPDQIMAQDGDLIVWIPNDDGNKEWQAYVVWINEGNVPNDPNGNPKTGYVLPPARKVPMPATAMPPLPSM